VPQREIEGSTNPSPINPIFSLEDLMDISDEEPRKQKRIPITSRKKLKS